ncbi:MAG: trypsin-like peptidase domain-containing protein, partial [Candidatus Bathyarchaeia archaeon]
MSDNWILDDMRQARRRDYLFTIVIVLLLVNVGATVFLFAYTHHYVSDLRVRNGVLETQITSLNQKIESLSSQLSLQKYLNASEFLLLPQIYNETMFSVVMIMVETPQYSAQGSGFVYDKEGHIITNNHVVEGATEIEVTFIEGTIAPATIVGTDLYSDLAIIDVDVDPGLLYPLTLGNSSDLVVGETVIAIGNPYGLSNSMSAGIVSQLSRELRAPGDHQDY